MLGGSSAGRGDCTAAVLDQVGAVTVHGVAVRPGHPVVLGHAQAGAAARVVPVIGVPGYPLAAAVAFELFALPALARIEGTAGDVSLVRAALSADFVSRTEVEEWIPVALVPAGDPSRSLTATPCPGRGAGALTRLVCADAWWPVPIGRGRFHQGDIVEVRPLASATGAAAVPASSVRDEAANLMIAESRPADLPRHQPNGGQHRDPVRV